MKYDDLVKYFSKQKPAILGHAWLNIFQEKAYTYVSKKWLVV